MPAYIWTSCSRDYLKHPKNKKTIKNMLDKNIWGPSREKICVQFIDSSHFITKLGNAYSWEGILQNLCIIIFLTFYFQRKCWNKMQTLLLIMVLEIVQWVWVSNAKFKAEKSTNMFLLPWSFQPTIMDWSKTLEGVFSEVIMLNPSTFVTYTWLPWGLWWDFYCCRLLLQGACFCFPVTC